MRPDRSIQTGAATSAAASTASSTDRTQTAIQTEECSTSYDLSHSQCPDFLQRKGAFNSRGQLILKNLSYEELEQWCLQEGILSRLIP